MTLYGSLYGLPKGKIALRIGEMSEFLGLGELLPALPAGCPGGGNSG